MLCDFIEIELCSVILYLWIYWIKFNDDWWLILYFDLFIVLIWKVLYLGLGKLLIIFLLVDGLMFIG